jgi:glyoxylase-like metal-dependent hydrolase (beta-lactamase superfamily II)
MRFIATIVFSFCFAAIHAQHKSPKVKISHLTGDFYVYTTYKDLGNGLFPSNSMYMLTRDGALLFDTPRGTTQFQPLLDSIQSRHNQKVLMCIATHFHSDRTAGLAYYRQQGVKTYTTKLTDELAKTGVENRAEFLIESDTAFSIAQHNFQTYYAGQGHTKDNIVIWFDNEKILYVGCLIKSIEAKDLGYPADANASAWAAAIKNIQRKFKGPNYIIPGLQEWHSKASLEHTLKLIRV